MTYKEKQIKKLEKRLTLWANKLYKAEKENDIPKYNKCIEMIQALEWKIDWWLEG